MLIFKINIYEMGASQFSFKDQDPVLTRMDFPKFLGNCLEETLHYFSTREAATDSRTSEDLAGRFPQGHRFGNDSTLQTLCQNLMEGHLSKEIWYSMNTYHFCVLYDSILRHGYNYNHQSGADKLRQYPELSGKLLRVVHLVDTLFFNTGFLMDEEKYYLLTSLEKEQRGLNCQGLFGVIHGLAPAPEEMELQRQPGHPYSIAV